MCSPMAQQLVCECLGDHVCSRTVTNWILPHANNAAMLSSKLRDCLLFAIMNSTLYSKHNTESIPISALKTTFI